MCVCVCCVHWTLWISCKNMRIRFYFMLGPRRNIWEWENEKETRWKIYWKSNGLAQCTTGKIIILKSASSSTYILAIKFSYLVTHSQTYVTFGKVHNTIRLLVGTIRYNIRQEKTERYVHIRKNEAKHNFVTATIIIIPNIFKPRCILHLQMRWLLVV